MNYPVDDGLSLERRLEEITKSISNVIIEPPEIKLKLQPSQLTVKKGPRGINSFCIPNNNGQKIILIGADLYDYMYQYTRVAAAYFLPKERYGPRPSSFWSTASSSLATTLDWLVCPISEIHYPTFQLSPRQEERARTFANLAYRFNLCHEISHILLGHLDESSESLKLLKNGSNQGVYETQKKETDADQLALRLHINSLSSILEFRDGFASSLYFIYLMDLLRGKLSRLSKLVWCETTEISLSHPPNLLRAAMISGMADHVFDGDNEELKRLFSGTGDNLMEQLHPSLSKMNIELWNVADEQSDTVTNSTKEIILEIVNHNKSLIADQRILDNYNVEEIVEINHYPKLIREFHRLLVQSPIGVLTALEFSPRTYSWENEQEKHLLSTVIEIFANELPQELIDYRKLSPEERCKKSFSLS